ncbi:hypothetical protein V8G54_015017, partial [Vigna mungo]
TRNHRMKWVISVPNKWIRILVVECRAIILVERSIESKSLWQIWIGQEQTAIGNKVSPVFSNGFDPIFPVITSGNYKSAIEDLSHWRQVFIWTSNSSHSGFHHVTVQNVILIECIDHVKPQL